MKQTRSLSVLWTIWLLLILAAKAHALSITIGPLSAPEGTLGSAIYGSPYEETVTVPQFNPVPGTLESISFTLEVDDRWLGVRHLQPSFIRCAHLCRHIWRHLGSSSRQLHPFHRRPLHDLDVCGHRSLAGNNFCIHSRA